LTGCAIAALKAILFDKSCLNRFQYSGVGKALNGRYPIAIV
jgi:hypothetical protein